MDRVATVILDTNIEKPLDYSIPEDMLHKLLPGMRVEIEVKGSIRKGFIFSLKKESEFKSLKPIKNILSEQIISSELFHLALWMAKYYCTSLNKVLKCIIPTSVREKIKPKMISFISLIKTKKETAKIAATLRQTHHNQAKVLDLLLLVKKGLCVQDILEKIKISKSPIQTLVKKKILKEEKIVLDANVLLQEDEYFLTTPKKLNEDQNNAYTSICDSIDKKAFETHLIYGITGSGKTEIYLQAIEHALSKNKSVIMLVPEVALTSQTIERFRSRFSSNIAILHHKRSHGERFDAWHAIKEKKAQIIIGARSAIFCPVVDLGLIILDEEHDFSYKQSEEAPTYHTKHIALMRCKLANCPLVLGSATPSIESFYLAKEKKYILHNLPNRATNASLSPVTIIDMRRENKNQFSHFSEKLLNAIKNRYDKGEQTILFLNRRGFHSFLFCSNCSHVITCPHCDVSLTYHKNKNVLLCHSCHFSTLPVSTCPCCLSSSYMQYKGFGTEHVQRSLNAIFPEIRTLRIDRDTTSSKNSHEDLFKQFRSGKADVLIGTQMIVKGLHFPSVTLVGVLNSDGALNIPDFRSSEIVFQLLTQVAGRAGRSFLPGEVMIQTYLPNNRTIKLAADQHYLSFFEEEIESRKAFDYPPFTRMVKFIFSGLDENKTKTTAEQFREKIINTLTKNCHIHPLIPCGRAKIKDKFRFFFIIRYSSVSQTLGKIEYVRQNFKIPTSINLLIDVDPTNTYL